MRIVSLFALVVLLPAFVHAADPPTLTTYTLSHDTIYPTATEGSGLATTTTIDTAFSEQVKASIKIISSGNITVKSLYSSSGVTNPTPKIWDGTNTAGAVVSNGTYTILISATSTATGLATTDSSKTVTIASSGATPSGGSTDTTDDDISDTATTKPSGGGPTEYLTIPTLRIITGGDRTVSSGADTAFTAVVYDGKGNRRDDTVVKWSFGDGMQRTGASVFHKYYEPGEYLAIVRVATSDGGDARAEIAVTVKNAGITIASVTSRGITLENKDSRTLDLSLWRISMGGQEFKIPEDTQILAGRTILFPSQIIQLPISDTASLLYPSGETAAMYPPAPKEQPPFGILSYKKVSEVRLGEASARQVEPALSASVDISTHDEAVVAPSAVSATETAEGAALPATSPTDSSKTKNLFGSPWFLGLVGIVALAGTAFIFI